MSVANMIIVQVAPLNEVKTADRLLENEMVIVNGGVIGLVKDAGFQAANENKVDITFSVTTAEGGTAETNMIVDRKHLFNVVTMLPVK